MLIIQLGTDENIKENIICDCYAFIAFELKKIQILKLFGPIMQKRAVEQKNSWSISSNRDQIYNGTIKNYLCAKKNYLISKKSYQGSDHM